MAERSFAVEDQGDDDAKTRVSMALQFHSIGVIAILLLPISAEPVLFCLSPCPCSTTCHSFVRSAASLTATRMTMMRRWQPSGRSCTPWHPSAPCPTRSSPRGLPRRRFGPTPRAAECDLIVTAAAAEAACRRQHARGQLPRHGG